MPTRQELEETNIIQLAVLCQRVADSPTAEKATAEKSLKLKSEWMALVARETPNAGDYKTHEKIQAEKAELKKRMEEFLAQNL